MKTILFTIGLIGKNKTLDSAFKVKFIWHSATMYVFFNAVVYTRRKIIYQPFSTKQ